MFRVVQTYQADQLAIVETGIDWRNVPPQDGLYQRTRKAQSPIKVAHAHNTTDKENLNKTKWQPGGTLMCALKEHVPRVVDSSSDPEALGRWVSQVIEGKGAHHTRFVAAYKPCVNTGGNNTVYVQHQQHYRQQESDKEPVQAFLQDLKAAIQQWQASQERIIIYMDANEDVRQGPVADMFHSLGMKEQITSKHGPVSCPPATQDRNTQSKPIDGIWTNFDCADIRCGYMPFQEGLPGDHRDCWIDIPAQVLYGYNPAHLHTLHPPSLTTQDPRIRKRY